MPLASGPACGPGCALRHTRDRRPALPLRSPGSCVEPLGQAGPSGSPGPSWRNRLSLQAVGRLPSLAQPQDSLPAPEAPAPAHHSRSQAPQSGRDAPGWVAGRQGPRCLWGSPAQGRPSWGVSTGVWLSARIRTLSYCPQLRTPPHRGLPTAPGHIPGVQSLLGEKLGCAAHRRRSPQPGLQLALPKGPSEPPFVTGDVISSARSLSLFSVDQPLGSTPILEGQVQGCGQISAVRGQQENPRAQPVPLGLWPSPLGVPRPENVGPVLAPLAGVSVHGEG